MLQSDLPLVVRYHNDVVMLNRLLMVQEYYERSLPKDGSSSISELPTIIVSAQNVEMSNSNYNFQVLEQRTHTPTAELSEVIDFEGMVFPNKAVASRFCQFMVRFAYSRIQPFND